MNYNNSIRSGSSLSTSVESNTMLLAGESYSSMCENEKIKIRRIVKNLIDTFNYHHHQQHSFNKLAQSKRYFDDLKRNKSGNRSGNYETIKLDPRTMARLRNCYYE